MKKPIGGREVNKLSCVPKPDGNVVRLRLAHISSLETKGSEPMWEQYKRTFAKTQATIALVTAGTYLYMGHYLPRALGFFVVMQIAAFAGAAWGVRLKRKVDGKAW